MQGDFLKMQGGRHRSPAEIHEISIAWNGVSLLKRAGKSRETIFSLAGSRCSGTEVVDRVLLLLGGFVELR